MEYIEKAEEIMENVKKCIIDLDDFCVNKALNTQADS